MRTARLRGDTMGFVKAVGKEIQLNDKPILLRGFGLGGWLLPEGYMWKLYGKCDRPRRMEALIEKLCGKAYATSFWQSYFDRYITYWDMELIKSQGFNSIRLPLNARHLKEECTLAHIDDLVAWCKKLGLLVILDMHGAPGGQTGTNIDDSERDLPELFENDAYQQELIDLWRMLACRYKDETAVAGYDLFNEPLPEWFSKYNTLVLPLYRKLTHAIREVDKNHMIIVEGVHWATDFSIFEVLESEPLDDNCMLQFHKYWSNPDKESILPYLDLRERLNMPLFMGEGGENNLSWYTAVFPLYERENISWSFWSYKKMDCRNSPITFPVPAAWETLIQHLDGELQLSSEQAQRIFDAFLHAVATPMVNQDVFCALNRKAPFIIPAEHYDAYKAASNRIPGADYRMTDGLTIQFLNGKKGQPDFKRYGGEEQPEEENLVLRLRPFDSAAYHFSSDKDCSIILSAAGPGHLSLRAGDWQQHITLLDGWGRYTANVLKANIDNTELCVTCEAGDIMLDDIKFKN